MNIKYHMKRFKPHWVKCKLLSNLIYSQVKFIKREGYPPLQWQLHVNWWKLFFLKKGQILMDKFEKSMQELGKKRKKTFWFPTLKICILPER